MKFLIFLCALLAAKASQKQIYEPHRQGPTHFLLSTLSNASSLLPNVHISPIPQQNKFQNFAKGLQGAQLQQPIITSHQQTSAQGSADGVVSGPLSQNVQVHGAAIQGTTSPVDQIQHVILGFEVESSREGCPHGLVRNIDSRCISPVITRNIFAYAPQHQEVKTRSPPLNIPPPKVEHNIVLIHTQDQRAPQGPIIVPPPHQKHIIYVLNKQSEYQGQRVIEVPKPETKTPEVYFVNYADGETPTLPDGIDFETALSSAIHGEGQIIGGSNGSTKAFSVNTVANEFVITSSFERNMVDKGDVGLIFGTESDLNQENLVPNNRGNEKFIWGSKNLQRITSNEKFPDMNGNLFLDSSSNGYLISPVTGKPIPRLLSESYK